MADLKAIPSDATILEASNLEVFDKQGSKVRFGSLYEEEKVVVVFIRESLPTHVTVGRPEMLPGHFFCGVSPILKHFIISLNIHKVLPRICRATRLHLPRSPRPSPYETRRHRLRRVSTHNELLRFIQYH